MARSVDQTLRVEVLTGVGTSGEREPVEIIFGRRHIAVQHVLDRWFGCGYRYFKLLGEDGSIYILRHEEGRDDWEMTFFERVPKPTPKAAAWRHRSATARPSLMC